MKFTYYTIIGKDLNLLKGHVENVKNYAGFDYLACDKEFLVIVYTNDNIDDNITTNILDYCSKNDIRTVIYEEPSNDFLYNLYACWNLGYEAAEDGLVFRGGSDQVFSKDSFPALYEAAMKTRGRKIVLQANTIENIVKLRELGGKSRHFEQAFGNNFEEFDYTAFEAFCELINVDVTRDILDIDDALAHWQKPTLLDTSLGRINRLDGCSWLMERKEWLEYGPLPTIEDGITGDVIIHDRMQRDRYEQFLVRDCITYHFVQGER